ncbi:hypothetical protein NFI96_017273 [Prochilodus magdalenae]|nr:hypothetical protein NFI96_017273 [Prochilodus magdalenae]
MGSLKVFRVLVKLTAMENLDFSEEEIEQQLAALGFANITKERLREFKRDLDLLIFHEKSKSQTSAEWTSPKSQSSSCKSPPVITKEKVQVHGAGSGYYMYGAADQQRPVFTSTFHEDSYENGLNPGPYDSYIRHSVAPRYTRPSTAPNRLEVEEAPSEIYHSELESSQTVSPDRDLHMNAKPSIKRKVLRDDVEKCDVELMYSDFQYSRRSTGASLKSVTSLHIVKILDSEEEQKECFATDESRGKTTEIEPGINMQGNKQETEGYVKESSMNDRTGVKLEEQERYIEELCEQYYVKEHSKDEGTEKRAEQEIETCEDSENDSDGMTSGTEGEDDKDERGNTDKSSESNTESGVSRSEEEESEDYVKEDSEFSGSEDEQESEEEEDESLFKLEEKENKLESYNAQNEIAFDGEKAMDGTELTNEETGSEDLFCVEEKEEESDTEEYDKDEDTEKLFGNEGEQREHVAMKYSMDSQVEEESESDVFESEEEIECFVGNANNDLMSCERLKRKQAGQEELCNLYVNQDGIGKLVLKEGSMCEGLEEKSERQIDIEEEKGGDNLNKYYTPSNIEEKRLDEWNYGEHSKEEQDQNNTTCVMDKQHGNSNVQNDEWENRVDTAVTELTDQLYIQPAEINNGGTVSEQTWENSIDQLENEQKKEEDVYGENAFDRYPGSMGSPTLSTLTSGYGTYRPDSPKDDLDVMDYRDDCTLAGLEEDAEYSNIIYCEGDDNQSVYQHNIFLEASEEQVTSLSLRGSEHSSLNHCDAGKGVAVQHIVDDGQDVIDDNRLGSSDIREENDQALYFSASVPRGLPASEKTHGIPSEGLSKGNHNMAYGSDEWEPNTKFEDYNHHFNLRLSKSVTVVKHTNEHDAKEKRKTKRAKTQFFKHEPLSGLEERLDNLHVSASHERHELDSESEETGSYSDRHSSATEEMPCAFQAYIKGMGRSRSESDIRPRPKSFIRPVMDHPHTRNLKKTDPVAKYFQYKQTWEMFKPPGEKSRKELHWAIREQLMYQPPPPKPQRTYVPNTYVVPTEKKRSALRWEIRHDLANGIIPTKITYP